MEIKYRPDRDGNYQCVQTWEDGSEISTFVAGTRTDTIRIDIQTVEDIFYYFDLEQGIYVEHSRTTRIDPLPPDRIAQLETENLELKLALAELAEAQQTDKLDVQLALAELAEILTGGA